MAMLLLVAPPLLPAALFSERDHAFSSQTSRTVIQAIQSDKISSEENMKPQVTHAYSNRVERTKVPAY